MDSVEFLSLKTQAWKSVLTEWQSKRYEDIEEQFSCEDIEILSDDEED